MCRLTTRVTGPGHRLITYRDLVNWSWAYISMPSPMTQAHGPALLCRPPRL
ncbi:hypothetical protein LOK49_LG02G00640 [Camellia lanceoleosa]|uniref:Uncharacterized protein n=1 Tax=Camellia lanceoleosa TaxID=1840588 RepID=A0ACC0IN02_9ERIC|nr:hypothetical protein LOK49_LG02G00640 [Camellia lanceoleosa]